MTTKSFQVGDRVAFARAFLRSTGQFTGPGGFMRGTVTDIQEWQGVPQLVTVAWDSKLASWEQIEAHTSRALACNLVLVSRIHLEPA
jgi:hypothetical protein